MKSRLQNQSSNSLSITRVTWVIKEIELAQTTINLQFHKRRNLIKIQLLKLQTVKTTQVSSFASIKLPICR